MTMINNLRNVLQHMLHQHVQMVRSTMQTKNCVNVLLIHLSSQGHHVLLVDCQIIGMLKLEFVKAVKQVTSTIKKKVNVQNVQMDTNTMQLHINALNMKLYVQMNHHSIMEKTVFLVIFLPIGMLKRKNVLNVQHHKIIVQRIRNV